MYLSFIIINEQNQKKYTHTFFVQISRYLCAQFVRHIQMVPDFNLKSSSLQNPSWSAFELPLGHVSRSISENVEKSFSRDEISSGSIASFFSKCKELSEAAHIQLLHQLVQNLGLEPGKIHSIPHARGVILFLLAMERVAEEGCLDASPVPVLNGQDHLGSHLT